MEEEVLTVARLREVDRVIAIVCGRNAFYGADAEDFNSWVKLRLIDNDAAILRKYEKRSSFATYISVVIHRLLLDYRNHLLGKWRPSAAAKRLGAAAVALEKLLHRDRRPLDDAIRELKGVGHDANELYALAVRLPSRYPRRYIPIDLVDTALSVAAETVEQHTSSREHAILASVAGVVVRAALAELGVDDRQLFQLHFGSGMTIAEIARALQVEQKPLYRRMQRILAAIRSRLESSGIGSVEAEDLVESVCELDFGLGEKSAGCSFGHDTTEDEGRAPNERTGRSVP
jgi:RNA polymerase sigma factor for flagellar operon FliA